MYEASSLRIHSMNGELGMFLAATVKAWALEGDPDLIPRMEGEGPF